MKSPKNRFSLADNSIVDWTITPIKPDKWRPHGIKYSMAWVQNDVCRVLFDNHHGKHDHVHKDGTEESYVFTNIDKLIDDFKRAIRLLGGKI